MLHTLFYFIIAISVLVSFHEYGHFWVARKAKVKVLRFSLGFGKILWSYQKHPDSTQYVVSLIPLGGYVKMVDEREGEVKTDDLPFAFNRQPLFIRTAIVAAGPIFNLLLAILLFWCVLVIGETGIKPMIGEIAQGTIAADAGFVEGDEIISVNDIDTPTWMEALNVLASTALEGNQNIKVLVKNLDDLQNVKNLKLSWQDTQNPDVFFQHLGFKPWSPKLPPVIGKILPNSAAFEAGLKQGDLIISADNQPMTEWMQWVSYVRAHPELPINLIIERDGVSSAISITPKKTTVDQKIEGKIGATVFVPEQIMKSITVEYSLTPLAAIPAAIKTTYYYSATSLKMMAKMLIGNASVENLSGPISIAQYAGQSASMGLVHFIKYMALVSVSLGVLNLLPIPVLDGGHLLFFAIEAIKGSSVSDKTQLHFQQVGIALLFSLMVLAMFLDIERLIQ